MSSTTERWTAIRYYKGYTFDGRFEVSNWGNVRNVKTQKPLATYSNQRGQGYLKTKITDETGTRRSLYIHQLVAFYFLEQRPQEGNEVDHIDGNAHNNSFTNLRYVSHQENMKAYQDARRQVV